MEVMVRLCGGLLTDMVVSQYKCGNRIIILV